MNQILSTVPARLKTANRWHIALGVFLAVIFLFLAVRASDEFRWSDWGFGDAQTLLSLRQWEEGGWFANHFLFIPQGYAKIVRMFDDPVLRHHAHGTCPGSSPRVGPRLLYTHYPAGYLVPYAVFFKLGLDSMFDVRILSLLLSFGALIFMYVLFAKITSPGIAFTAVFFYALTPTFLGYSDTLANQPIDDLLRFSFMLAVVMSTRADSDVLRRKWMISAWILEFLLSAVSFDSVFFLFVWLIGWDFIDRQGFRWKRYFIYGLAPFSAHFLQFLQNVWYLGFSDALIDIKDAFLLKNAADAAYNIGQDRLTVILGSIQILFTNLFDPAYFMTVLAVAYVVYTFILKSRQENELPRLRLLVVLFLSGLSFILILPHAARMPYEARQMIPFAALLVSGVIWSFLKEFHGTLHGHDDTAETGNALIHKMARIAYLLFTAVFLLVFWYRFMLNSRSPVYYIPDEKTDAVYEHEITTNKKFDLMKFRTLRDEALLASEIRKIPTAFEPVYFSVRGFSLFWDPKYVPGYPQIMPIIEYYAGSRAILCFDQTDGLDKDLAYLIQNSKDRFSPVLISSDLDMLLRGVTTLGSMGLLTSMPPRPPQIRDRYVLDLTRYIKWGGTAGSPQMFPMPGKGP